MCGSTLCTVTLSNHSLSCPAIPSSLGSAPTRMPGTGCSVLINISYWHHCGNSCSAWVLGWLTCSELSWTLDTATCLEENPIWNNGAGVNVGKQQRHEICRPSPHTVRSKTIVDRSTVMQKDKTLMQSTPERVQVSSAWGTWVGISPFDSWMSRTRSETSRAHTAI